MIDTSALLLNFWSIFAYSSVLSIKISDDCLSRFEKEHRDLTEVEVYEMLRLVCYIRAKVASNDAVPRWIVFLVKLLFDESSDVFLDVVLL